MGTVLRRLPQRFKNILRISEVAARERFLGNRRQDKDLPVPQADSEFELEVSSAQRILIVDDTIDTGRTMLAAVAAVRSANPRADVRTAVLASTFRRPPVLTDYCLYERTMLTFPWSFDAEG